jgi:hypothetical protein
MENIRPERIRIACFVAAGVVVVSLLANTASARTVWLQISRILSLHGDPEPASANVLSEHHIEALDSMSEQAQAEFLLERSINHYTGANDYIAKRVSRWRGKIRLDDRLDSLFRMAINSDDLRVRAAAIEVDIAARNLEKSVETVDRLEPIARTADQGPRQRAVGSRPAGWARRDAGACCGNPAGFSARPQREHPLLGCRRVGLPWYGQHG